jgi:hypothetical protein
LLASTLCSAAWKENKLFKLIQITRLLDPKDGNVTLVTLQRAAELLGRKVRLELV